MKISSTAQNEISVMPIVPAKVSSPSLSQRIRVFIHRFVHTHILNRFPAPPLSQAKQIKLILHFDLNKTLIAEDNISGQSLDNVVNELLTHQYKDCWTPDIKDPISYNDYVCLYIHPGNMQDLMVKKARRELFGKFISFLKTNNHPLKEKVEKDYRLLLQKLNNNFIFPAFFKMIDKLRQQQVKFNIILRTFGQDLDRVINYMSPELAFHQKGFFSSGQLHLTKIDQPNVVHKINNVYQAFKSSGNMAIRDDWKTWHANGERETFGKKFPIDKTDKETISIFFDDIVDETEGALRNGISPFDANTGKPVLVLEALRNRHIYRVDTFEAIKDDNYFIDRVNQSIAFHTQA